MLQQRQMFPKLFRRFVFVGSIANIPFVVFMTFCQIYSHAGDEKSTKVIAR